MIPYEVFSKRYTIKDQHPKFTPAPGWSYTVHQGERQDTRAPVMIRKYEHSFNYDGRLTSGQGPLLAALQEVINEYANIYAHSFLGGLKTDALALAIEKGNSSNTRLLKSFIVFESPEDSLETRYLKKGLPPSRLELLQCVQTCLEWIQQINSHSHAVPTTKFTPSNIFIDSVGTFKYIPIGNPQEPLSTTSSPVFQAGPSGPGTDSILATLLKLSVNASDADIANILSASPNQHILNEKLTAIGNSFGWEVKNAIEKMASHKWDSQDIWVDLLIQDKKSASAHSELRPSHLSQLGHAILSAVATQGNEGLVKSAAAGGHVDDRKNLMAKYMMLSDEIERITYHLEQEKKNKNQSKQQSGTQSQLGSQTNIVQGRAGQFQNLNNSLLAHKIAIQTDATSVKQEFAHWKDLETVPNKENLILTLADDNCTGEKLRYMQQMNLFEQLTIFKKVRVDIMCNQKLTDSDVSQLTQLLKPIAPKLDLLRITMSHSPQISNGSIPGIVELLPSCTLLEQLYLDFYNNQNINDDGVRQLSNGLAKCNPNMTTLHLNLSNCSKITDQSLVELVNSLNTLRKLKSLTLSLAFSANVGPMFSSALSDYLRGGNRPVDLEDLWLAITGCSKITEDNFKPLAASLKGFSKLRSGMVAHRKFGHLAIAEFIKKYSA